MKLSVFGAGYAGLVTACCLAELGNTVICVEKSRKRLDLLREGRLPIFEPGLDELLCRNLQAGRIHFTENVGESLDDCEIVFLCVGTPQHESGHADLSQVKAAAREIAECARRPLVVAEKSTVPVNSHQLVKLTLQKYGHPGVELEVASNPEFLREGTAIHDFMEPVRIVVGVESRRAEAIFRQLYSPMVQRGHPMIVTRPAEAELIKQAANSFLALKISYINMVAELCEKVGADVVTVSEGLGKDPRIGPAFLHAGIGYGGSCIPKDVSAFISTAEEHGVDFGMLREVQKVNARRRTQFISLLERVLGDCHDKVISIWGLAFKPDTDDVRDSPSMDVVRALQGRGAQLRLVDPKASSAFALLVPADQKTQYVEDAYEALRAADALVILTDWAGFVSADWTRVKQALKAPVIVDGRNVEDAARMHALGLQYYSLGRPGNP